MLEKGAIRNSDGTVSVLVRYKDEEGHAVADSLDRDGHGHVISERSRVEVINANVEDIETLAKNPHIEMVELDQEVHALPNMRANDVDADKGRRRLQDTEDTPYGITMVNPDNLQQGENNIKICVVDTGYDNGHEDLPTLVEENDGFSPYVNQLWYVDGHGHGSHCAGTIGAIGGNNVGVTSVNPISEKFSFFIGKGLRDTGSGSTSGVMDAVQKCVDAGAKVISMSLGGAGPSQLASDQYKEHYDTDGVLIIAAAGNGGNGAFSYPASYKHVMSVAAVDSNKNKASFSQFNDQVEIAAPGVGVKSTIPDDKYATWSGTSMACPHVAGVAALVWSHFPDCSNKQIREALILSAEDLGASGCDNEYGFGLVDAKAAYDYLSNRGCGFSVGETLGGCNQCVECTSAPTSSPTAFPACPGNEKYFKLSLETDNYGGETSWKVTSPTSGDVISGSGYESGTTHTERHCIQSDACTFEISDSYGDGICCSYGEGSYTVWVDDIEKGTGGDFGNTETISLCDASPTSPPTVTPTVSPTVPPTVSPTVPPTVPPTPAPVTPTTPPPTPPVSCLTVKIDILTDYFPTETSWTISDQEGNEVASGSGYTEKQTNSIHDVCLESNNVHTFSISDTWGDGICCSYGSGSYQLSLGETTFIEGGDFGSSVEHRFLLLDLDTVMIDHSTCAGEAVNGANNMDDFVKRGAGEKCKGGQHCLSNKCDGNGICE